MAIKHKFTCIIADDANAVTAGQVVPSNWNDNHDIRFVQEVTDSPAITSGALTLNLDNAGVFLVVLNAAITSIVITGTMTTGLLGSFFLIFTADGTARAVTWPASVKWDSGFTPVLSVIAGKRDAFTFFTSDGGTNWYGVPSLKGA